MSKHQLREQTHDLWPQTTRIMKHQLTKQTRDTEREDDDDDDGGLKKEGKSLPYNIWFLKMIRMISFKPLQFIYSPAPPCGDCKKHVQVKIKFCWDFTWTFSSQVLWDSHKIILICTKVKQLKARACQCVSDQSLVFNPVHKELKPARVNRHVSTWIINVFLLFHGCCFFSH